jgi:pimeloyl-ACP methyl ester carboxylesterase
MRRMRRGGRVSNGGRDLVSSAAPESTTTGDFLPTETTVTVGDAELVMLTAGEGRPLVVLHDELGFPGWLQWTRDLADHRQLLVPLQPGFGKTPRLEWANDYRDLASFYLRIVRDLGLLPADVIGFSAGGYIAAEMVAANPQAFNRVALVAPLGLRPSEGEIFDFLAVTARRHLEATVSNQDVPEVNAIYGGAMTPETFELFEAARAETSRLGWEPFMFSPSLGERLKGADGVEALIVWGDTDRIVPRACAEEYARVLSGSRLEILPKCGHRPEIEATPTFSKLLNDFFLTP